MTYQTHHSEDPSMKPVSRDATAIIHHASGGTTLTGDTITLYAAKSLQQYIGLYMKTRMIPTRGVTISSMLKRTTAITKKPYKNNRAGWQQTYDDLQVWCDTLRSAIPDVYEVKT